MAVIRSFWNSLYASYFWDLKESSLCSRISSQKMIFQKNVCWHYKWWQHWSRIGVDFRLTIEPFMHWSAVCSQHTCVWSTHLHKIKHTILILFFHQCHFLLNHHISLPLYYCREVHDCFSVVRKFSISYVAPQFQSTFSKYFTNLWPFMNIGHTEALWSMLCQFDDTLDNINQSPYLC